VMLCKSALTSFSLNCGPQQASDIVLIKHKRVEAKSVATMTAPDLLRLAIGCPSGCSAIEGVSASAPVYMFGLRAPFQHNLRKWDGYPAASLNAGPRVWWFWGKSGSGHLRPRSDVSDLKKLALSGNRSSRSCPSGSANFSETIGNSQLPNIKFPVPRTSIPCSRRKKSLLPI
jgi:hypothetical protein